jgi:hypothetical protein
VDIGIDVFWAVELNDPVDSGKIKTSGGYVCADKEGRFGARESVESGQSGRLFLFSVKVEEG